MGSHYEEAEANLVRAGNSNGPDDQSYYLKAAHVHAMLAVADANARVADRLDNRLVVDVLR